MKKTLNENGIQCTCPVPRTQTMTCRAANHIPIPTKSLDPKDFIDCNGDLITEGTILRYRNPKFPGRVYPAHTAFVRYGQCFLRDDEHPDLVMIKKTNWRPSRFQIMVVSLTHIPPQSFSKKS